MRQNLINARKAKNMTQAEVAELSGLSPKSISAIERGRMTGSVKTWQAIAAALEIPIQDIWPAVVENFNQ